MRKLIDGIHHFQREEFLPLQGLFEQLARGQNPETLFITCSDSRIVPNLLTRTGPGDLFILRNAGNIVPPLGSGGGEAATIEYAVAVLGVEHVIVCGHTHCGAVNALLHPETLSGLPAVADWLRHAEATRRIVRENYADREGESLMRAAVGENVLVQLEHLHTLPAVAAALAKGRLHLHGWVYDIETGEVWAYDVAAGHFVPVAEYRGPEAGAAARRRSTYDI